MSFDPVTKRGFGISVERRAPVSLKDRFVIPPFSILRTTDADWVNRKSAWLSLGIQSEVGRGGHESSAPGGSLRPACDYSNRERGDGKGEPVQTSNGVLFKSQDRLNEIMAQGKPKKKHKTAMSAGLTFGEMPNYDGSNRNQICGTSIFDPVLCELAYRWWCPTGGTIVDPFSGGSVRGVVSAALGFEYHGVDLRLEQVDANKEQWETIGKIFGPDTVAPTWYNGDSRRITRLLPDDVQADFIFSCPPYGDLEVYSDEEGDISNMSYEEFLDAYRRIIHRTCTLLKENRFACFVVGEFRDKKTGAYRNFVSETIQAFLGAGLMYYNEAILITAIGSLPIRVKKQFNSGRKIGKTHQNILVFYKGDPKKIKEIFGELG